MWLEILGGIAVAISPFFRLLFEGPVPSAAVIVITFLGSLAIGLVFMVGSEKWPELNIWKDPSYSFMKHCIGSYTGLWLSSAILFIGGHYKNAMIVSTFALTLGVLLNEILSISNSPTGGLSGLLKGKLVFPWLIKFRFVQPAARMSMLLHLHKRKVDEDCCLGSHTLFNGWKKNELEKDQWRYRQAQVSLIGQRLEILVPIRDSGALADTLEAWEPGLRSILQCGLNLEESWHIRPIDDGEQSGLTWAFGLSIENLDNCVAFAALSDSIRLLEVFSQDLASFQAWLEAMIEAKREGADLHTQILAALAAEVDFLMEVAESKTGFGIRHINHSVLMKLNSIKEAIKEAQAANWQVLIECLQDFLHYDTGSDPDTYWTPLNVLDVRIESAHAPFCQAVLTWIKTTRVAPSANVA